MAVAMRTKRRVGAVLQRMAQEGPGTVSETKPVKHCRYCGRVMAWRKAWAKNWDEVRYCSQRCRRRKVRPIDRQLESTIMDLLAQRGVGESICPSEAAQAIDEDDWRDLMEPARCAARRLVNDGVAVITQRGREVDPSTATGPIRIQRATRP